MSNNENGKRKYGIRLRDYNHPAVKDFHGIQSFPVSLEWLIPAVFEEFDELTESVSRSISFNIH